MESAAVPAPEALKGIILGSTTNKLLHLTDRPVLVVPAKEA
jgi:nucleotide-binding universal stress UspA family protein